MIKHLGEIDRQQHRHRLGQLSCFDVMSPDGPYRIDFSMRDERLLATCLLQLATKEMGDNILDESFQVCLISLDDSVE